MLLFLAFLLLGSDAPSLEADARALLKQIVSKDYAAAVKNFDATMTSVLPADKLADLYEKQLIPQLGAFQSSGDAHIESQNGLRLVTIATKWEKVPIDFVVAFDQAGKIAGIWFRPDTPPAETKFAGYTTKTQLRLPFDDQWFVYWGGRTTAQNYHVIARDQRFAYDLAMVRDGKSYSGDSKVAANYFAWNQPILAPAAGTVSQIQDGMDDNVPGVMNPIAPFGNHVILDHGNGEFSVFAHFKKGSVAVKLGEQVKAGQLLGRCGNSGNTSEPHLHYHLQNSNKLIDSDGLPAQFVNYVADGKRVERGEPVRGQQIMKFKK